MDENKIPIWEKANLTINEAAEYFNIGKNKLRELATDPRCTYSLSIGKKILIKKAEFQKYLSNIRYL